MNARRRLTPWPVRLATRDSRGKSRGFSRDAALVTAIETGRNGRTDTEGTAGLSLRFNDHLQLEGGDTVRSDGTWQVIFAWEWNFAGED